MPELCRFLGIVIGVFPRDHAPPHFHAVYGEYQITVEIQSGVVRGSFLKRALRLVLDGTTSIRANFWTLGLQYNLDNFPIKLNLWSDL